MGLTEPQARKQYGDSVKICKISLLSISQMLKHETDKSSFRALYFSMIADEHKEPTVYKLVCVGPEERVVGVHIMGQGSDEVMQGFAVAVKMKGLYQGSILLRMMMAYQSFTQRVSKI